MSAYIQRSVIIFICLFCIISLIYRANLGSNVQPDIYRAVTRNPDTSSNVDKTQHKVVPIGMEPNITNLKKEDETLTELKWCSFTERHQLLRQKCKERNLLQSPPNSSAMSSKIFVDHLNKLVFCRINKVASTTLMHILASLQSTSDEKVGKQEALSKYPLLKDFSMKEQSEILQKYLSFIIVRHPFDRLVSLWHFVMNFHPGMLFKDKYLPFIQEYLKENGFHWNLKNENIRDLNLSFKHFIKIFLENRDRSMLGVHLSIYFDQCSPCDVQYEHIFRTENLNNDMDTLYQHLRSVRGNLTFGPTPLANSRRLDTSNPGTRMMDRIWQEFYDVDRDTARSLHEIYEVDFELFGYHWDEKKGASCALTRKNGTLCC